MTEVLPADLHFPKPPFRIECSMSGLQTLDRPAKGYLDDIRRWYQRILDLVSPRATGLQAKPGHLSDRALQTLESPATGYLDDIRKWRQRVLDFVSPNGAGPQTKPGHLSDRGCMALTTFLTVGWSEHMTRWAVQSPYNVSAFPASALEASSVSAVELTLELLRWRAGMHDYLDDIWDVIGEPELDWEECNAIREFLRPIAGEQVCRLCLTEFTAGKLQPDEHQCLILAHVRAKWPSVPPAILRFADASPSSRANERA